MPAGLLLLLLCRWAARGKGVQQGRAASHTVALRREPRGGVIVNVRPTL